MSKLREYRKRNGLSQEDFARSVGVKKTTISRIETGERNPSFDLVARICRQTAGEITANDFMREQSP